MPDKPQQTEDPAGSSSATTSSGQGSSGLQRAGGFGARWLKKLKPGSGAQSFRDTLEDMLEEPVTELDEDELGFGGDERLMLSNILKLGEITAEDVAVPRADIKALDAEASFADISAEFREHQHSRMPVYRDTLDDIIGFLHIKDIFAAVDAPEKFDLQKALHDPLVVSPAMQVSMLLLRMRLNKVHMALVVDEFGGIDGLVTIEDLVEEIVGEIEDEHDDENDNPRLVRHKDEWRADARVTLDDFEAESGQKIDVEEHESEIDTLGGLVMSLAGSVPTLGEVLVHEPSGLEFRVTGADPRRLHKLVVKKSTA